MTDQPKRSSYPVHPIHQDMRDPFQCPAEAGLQCLPIPLIHQSAKLAANNNLLWVVSYEEMLESANFILLFWVLTNPEQLLLVIS